MILKEKFDKIRVYCSENSGFLSVVGIFIGILTYVFGNKTIGIFLFSIIIIWGLWYLFSDYLKKYNKILIIITTFISIIFIGYLIFTSFYKTNPKIFEYSNGLNLKYYEEFNGKNINISNNYKWIYEDSNNEFFTTINGTKTLATSSYPQRGYGMFQNLKNLDGDRILIGKFNLKEASKVGIRFMNTNGINSDEIKNLHNNECILQFYKNDKINEGYGHHVTKNIFLEKESSFKNYDFINGNYYILAKISGRQFSCYFQREGDDMIYPIIENKSIIFENLGGPVMTRFIQDEKSFPELLGFWLYSK